MGWQMCLWRGMKRAMATPCLSRQGHQEGQGGQRGVLSARNNNAPEPKRPHQKGPTVIHSL